MSLSNDLISQFVKMTNDTGKKETKDTTLYGTVVEYDGNNYVRLDGSDLLTPVDTTSTLHVDDRVTVDITKHNATVSGNISNPSVSGVEIKQSEENLILYFDEEIENLLLVFKDGYYEGITTVNAEGVQVRHTAYEGYTKMSYDGFYINNGTEDVFTATAEGLIVKGKITGSQIEGSDIKGSTFSSENDVFQVLSDGTVETNYLSVNGTVSTEVLDVGHIYNPKYPASLTGAVTVYIDPNNSSGISDYKDFQNGTIFGSFNEMINIMPRNLNGYNLTIRLNADVTENVALTNFVNGQVNIEFYGHTLYGYLYCYGASMVYRMYGYNSSDGASQYGKIMPSTGRSIDGYVYAVGFQYCQFAMTGISIYPDNTNKTKSSAIGCTRGVRGNVFNVSAYGDMRYFVRANYGSHIYVGDSNGTCNNAAFCATTGSIICIDSDNEQAGRNNKDGNPYWVGSGGNILSNQVLGMDKIKFTTTTNSGNNTNTSTGTTTTKTVYSTSGNTYRSTVYDNWKNDGTVRQGDWGYGDCQGCWFFGDSLYETMNAGTVKKVVIRIQRQSGGNNDLQTLTVKSHNYTTKPSGAPSYTNTIGTCSCAVGSSIDLIITDEATINKLKACKGLGLSIGSASSPYAVCSGSCSVIITYTT